MKGKCSDSGTYLPSLGSGWFELQILLIALSWYRMSAQEILEHSFLAVEPEVVLVATDSTKKHLHMLVVFKGMEKLSVKFEFNAVSYPFSSFVKPASFMSMDSID